MNSFRAEKIISDQKIFQLETSNHQLMETITEMNHSVSDDGIKLTQLGVSNGQLLSSISALNSSLTSDISVIDEKITNFVKRPVVRFSAVYHQGRNKAPTKF